MAQYRVERTPFGKQSAWLLADEASGARAWLAPQFGCNVYRFTVRAGDRDQEVLHSPASPAELDASRTRSGVPVMIPYPGRVRAARFAFGGREIVLPAADGRGHAIHGVVRQRGWRVVATGTDRAASVTCVVSSEDDPTMLAEWPFPMRVEHVTSLAAGRLRVALAVTNLGADPMPLGVGLHPYFRAPLGESGERGDSLVCVAATEHWEQEGALPTGQVEAPAGAVDLRTPRAIGSLPVHATPQGESVNLLYTRNADPRGDPLAPTGIGATLRDPATGLEVTMTTSDVFRALVLFTPPGTRSVSLEPHTCVPDAFNVAARRADTGLFALAGGETWRGWAEFAATGPD